MTYEIIKVNYDKKLWTINMVKFAVQAGAITPVQFQEITGTKYK